MSNINIENKSGAEKTCKHCKKKVNYSYDCENCNSSFHPSCAKQAKVINSENKVDCCISRGESEVTGQEKQNIQGEMSEKQLKIIVRDLLAEQLSPFKKIVQEDVAEIKKSTQYMSDCFDEQKKRVDEFLKEIKRLREENKLLKDRVQDLEDKINISEQKGKEKNLVLVGIPKQTEEQPKKIIKKIFATLKPEINENDIEETYRITKHEKAPILVKFKNYETKLKIVQKVKEMKGLKVQECGLTGENKNIFFNDDLTKQNQQLFKKAREYKVNKGLKAAYVFNGRIYIRENEQDPPIRIRSEADLV